MQQREGWNESQNRLVLISIPLSCQCGCGPLNTHEPGIAIVNLLGKNLSSCARAHVTLRPTRTHAAPHVTTDSSTPPPPPSPIHTLWWKKDNSNSPLKNKKTWLSFLPKDGHHYSLKECVKTLGGEGWETETCRGGESCPKKEGGWGGESRMKERVREARGIVQTDR